MKRWFALFLAVLLLAGLLAGCSKTGKTAGADAASDRMEGPGFATGQEALLASLDAIRRSDAEALLSCYAVETFVEHFRFDDYYAYKDYFARDAEGIFLPEGTVFGDTVNYWQRRFAVSTDAAEPFFSAANGCFADGLAEPDGMAAYISCGRLNDTDQRERYLETIADGSLSELFSGLQITGDVFDITQAVYDQLEAKARHDTREKKEANLQREAVSLGAEQIREYGVPVSVGGCDCLFTIRAVRYDGRWYVLKLGAYQAEARSMAGGFSLAAPGGEPVPASGTGSPAQASDRVSDLGFQGAGFASSEEAAKAYVEAFSRLDLPAVVSASLCDDYADENIPLYFVNQYKLFEMPYFGGSRYRALGRITAAETVIKNLLESYLTLTARLKGSDEIWDRALPGFSEKKNMVPTADTSSETRTAEREALRQWLSDPTVFEALAGITVRGTEKVMDETENEIFTKYAGLYHAEHYVANVVTVELAGETWYFWVESVCRNGRWYNLPRAMMYSLDKTYPQDHLLHN